MNLLDLFDSRPTDRIDSPKCSSVVGEVTGFWSAAA